MELYILYSNVVALLEEKRLKVHLSYVGNYFTSLEIPEPLYGKTFKAMGKTMAGYDEIDARLGRSRSELL